MTAARRRQNPRRRPVHRRITPAVRQELATKNGKMAPQLEGFFGNLQVFLKDESLLFLSKQSFERKIESLREIDRLLKDMKDNIDSEHLQDHHDIEEFSISMGNCMNSSAAKVDATVASRSPGKSYSPSLQQPVVARSTHDAMLGNNTVAGYSEKWTTLEAILNHGRRNRQHTSAEFTCHVQLKRIRNNQEWFRLTCGGGGCMKGVVREDNNMWCDGCENPVLFPRVRLELEVFDSTAEAVIVCFDDTAQRLTKATAHDILTAESGLSGVYNLYSTDIQDKFTPVIVRNPDNSISALPNCLQSLVGSTQTLLLDSCTYYDQGSFESFNCKNVLLYGDGCGCVGSSTPPSLSNKDNEVVPIPTPVKHVEMTIRQSTGDGIGDDSAMR
ncbi:putative nucleic acid-binding, replication factor A [Helianthus debilis subsp. tardiflorus]